MAKRARCANYVVQVHRALQNRTQQSASGPLAIPSSAQSSGSGPNASAQGAPPSNMAQGQAASAPAPARPTSQGRLSFRPPLQQPPTTTTHNAVPPGPAFARAQSLNPSGKKSLRCQNVMSTHVPYVQPASTKNAWCWSNCTMHGVVVWDVLFTPRSCWPIAATCTCACAVGCSWR